MVGLLNCCQRCKTDRWTSDTSLSAAGVIVSVHTIVHVAVALGKQMASEHFATLLDEAVFRIISACQLGQVEVLGCWYVFQFIQHHLMTDQLISILRRAAMTA